MKINAGRVKENTRSAEMGDFIMSVKGRYRMNGICNCLRTLLINCENYAKLFAIKRPKQCIN